MYRGYHCCCRLTSLIGTAELFSFFRFLRKFSSRQSMYVNEGLIMYASCNNDTENLGVLVEVRQ